MLANTIVKANSWFGLGTKKLKENFGVDPLECDGLAHSWDGNTFLNPPGGDTAKLRPELQDLSRSYPCIWWGKLVNEWMIGNVEQACFLIFQLNLFQSVQKLDGVPYTFFDFPMVVFKDRLRFLYPLDTVDGLPAPNTTLEVGDAPPGGSALVWLPPREEYIRGVCGLDEFRSVFEGFGALMNV
jgi:hypothetical protein